MEKLSSAMEMMEIKLSVSGCGDIAARVYKYPRPESGGCTRLFVCVCVMGKHECHTELFK